MKKITLLFLALALLPLSCHRGPKDGEYSLTVLSTNDVHGSWFDSTYIGNHVKRSLFAVNTLVDSVRRADGADKVVLIEVGDCLQGDNAAYYFNYVDTLSPHLFPRLVHYMGYDAVIWGNHDVETGHAVYDRVNRELAEGGTPFLAANALRNSDGKPYFTPYTIIKKGGLRIAILGYENANIQAWLAESVWSGIHFESIAARVQQDVDALRAKEHPDVVIVAMHTATGTGDGTNPEAEGLDVLNSVKGVDWVLCSHDHRPYVETRDSVGFLNSGSHCRFLAEGKMHLTVRGGAIVDKQFSTRLIPVDAQQADPAMRERFRPEFETVRAFTRREVGSLNVELRTRDSFTGPCPYIDLVHTLCLQYGKADLSIAAPLTYNATIPTGTLIFNDLFSIYPFENQLYVIRMSGEEIQRYLEASYNRWIQTWTRPGDHVLRIEPRDNARTGQKGWSFANFSYNFDSVAGINYTVDVTKPRGNRIQIASRADGSPFSPADTFTVAITSYRASGGGNLLDEIGIDTGDIDSRIVSRYPEIRNLLYDRLQQDDSIDPDEISNPALLGHWSFIPAAIAHPAIAADMALLFGN